MSRGCSASSGAGVSSSWVGALAIFTETHDIPKDRCGPSHQDVRDQNADKKRDRTALFMVVGV